jgi:hypothetical protein
MLAMRRSAADFVALARECGLDEFLAQSPKYFLLGAARLSPPRQPGRTLIQRTPALLRQDTAVGAPAAAPVAEAGRSHMQLVVLPLLKVQDLFPDMITVGRAANNDVVIDDVAVSKFHAYFRMEDPPQIVDADSSNGTKVGGKQLAPKAPEPLREGELVTIARLNFTFVSASTCWDRLQR